MCIKSIFILNSSFDSKMLGLPIGLNDFKINYIDFDRLARTLLSQLIYEFHLKIYEFMKNVHHIYITQFNLIASIWNIRLYICVITICIRIDIDIILILLYSFTLYCRRYFLLSLIDEFKLC